MSTIKHKLTYLALAAIPIYLWTKLIKTYLNYKKQVAEKVIIHHKHNCVVTYSKDGGMIGWPDYTERVQLNLDNYDKFLEPVVYFIDTAEKRLDIAIMIFYHDGIIAAVTRALRKGIAVRLILDARYDNNRRKMRELMKIGAHVMYDAKFFNSDTMMHYKYAVKDFNKLNGSGFSLCGSMNWTQSAFSENYEFLVLSTNRQVVGAFNKNFEETWEYFQKAKESNLVNENLYQL